MSCCGHSGLLSSKKTRPGPKDRAHGPGAGRARATSSPSGLLFSNLPAAAAHTLSEAAAQAGPVVPQPPPRCLTTISTSLVASTNLAAVRRSCCPRFPSASPRLPSAPGAVCPGRTRRGWRASPWTADSCSVSRSFPAKALGRPGRSCQTACHPRGGSGKHRPGESKGCWQGPEEEEEEDQGPAKRKGKQEAQAQGPRRADCSPSPQPTSPLPPPPTSTSSRSHEPLKATREATSPSSGRWAGGRKGPHPQIFHQGVRGWGSAWAASISRGYLTSNIHLQAIIL